MMRRLNAFGAETNGSAGAAPGPGHATDAPAPPPAAGADNSRIA